MNGTDQSEETVALAALVESGVSLLNTVNYLLQDVCTVSEISGEYITKLCCVHELIRCNLRIEMSLF